MNIESQSFLQRFYCFNDAVIRRVDIKYRDSVSFIISAQDSKRPEDDRWVNVELVIDGVTEFHLNESGKESWQVLSEDLRIVEADGELIFDFGYFDKQPADLTAMRQSKYCVIGRSFSWTVCPYSEGV